jgi:hypothetical protein
MRLPTTSEHAISKQFRIGSRNFGPWPIDLWDVSLPGFDGFIGEDFFKKHRVCINYPAGRVEIGD